MDSMGKQYRNILKNLEKNISNKEDLEYIKSEISNLFMLFFNEVDALRELYENKIETILDRQTIFEEKMTKIGDAVSNIEKDIYMDEDGSDIEILCPYCEHEFLIKIDELNNDVECPECKNLIELDWSDEEGCGGHCGGCSSKCMDDDEDDM